MSAFKFDMDREWAWETMSDTVSLTFAVQDHLHWTFLLVGLGKIIRIVAVKFDR